MMRNTVKALITDCPHEQIVMIGFSQGAAVADLALNGLQSQRAAGTNHVFADWITHVTLMGDPMRMPGRPIDADAYPTSWPSTVPDPTIENVKEWDAEQGILPHFLGDQFGENIPATFAKREQGWTRAVSWCVPGDMVCEYDGAGFDTTLHSLYGDAHLQATIADAARWHVINNLDRFRRSGP